MRTQHQALGPLLGLPAQSILQEDGTRTSLERVFQAVDADDSKSISKGEWISYFSSSAQCEAGQLEVPRSKLLSRQPEHNSVVRVDSATDAMDEASASVAESVRTRDMYRQYARETQATGRATAPRDSA